MSDYGTGRVNNIIIGVTCLLKTNGLLEELENFEFYTFGFGNELY